MSRASSYAASGPALTHLATCIASVDFACRTLESSNATLAEQTSDFSRLAQVLRSKRHFDLVSEQDIHAARDHLSAEIAPQLKELILRAEDAVQRDERKAKTLKGKLSQQSARLEQLSQLYGRDASNATPTPVQTSTASATSADDVQRLRQKAQGLRRTRESMQSQMAALEAEVKQLRAEARR